jgi:uncharacterized protein DUF3326
MIVNRTYVLGRAEIARAGGLLASVRRTAEAEPLRWFVSAATPTDVTVETTEYTGPTTEPLPAPAAVSVSDRDVVVSVVPTGIGCAIGGYAGDAAPVTALLAACADYVVTNPNAVNASNFIALRDNVLYTEGYYLDLFCGGAVHLYRPRANKVGVVVERAEPAALEQVLNVVNAVRAVHGVHVVDYVVTEEPIGTRCVRNPSGAYVGRIDRPDVLLAATRRLLAGGAEAIAVTTNVQDLPAGDYAGHFAGEHPNPVGGAEAVVSHLVAKVFGVAAAHAPMINFKDLPRAPRVVDARGAGEFVSASGLACVLIGLHRAPQVMPRAQRMTDVVTVDDVVAVVAPASALGGLPVLLALRRGIPVVAVRDNTTILDVTAAALGLTDVVEVPDYPSAAGVIMALRNGIPLAALRRPLVSFGGTA